MISEWQKLIRIVDWPELGCNVVAEYNADKLADEKRLEKAEQSTERKPAKQKKKRVMPASIHRGTCFVSIQLQEP